MTEEAVLCCTNGHNWNTPSRVCPCDVAEVAQRLVQLCGQEVLPSQSSFLCTVTASSENRARYCLLGPLVYSVTNSQAGQGAASEDGLVNPLPQDTGHLFLARWRMAWSLSSGVLTIHIQDVPVGQRR